MEGIRLATPEEIESIRSTSDITSTSAVVSMGDSRAVLRHCWEIDPVYFGESHNTSKRALFIWGIQNFLRLQGVREYYFNVEPDDEKWQEIVQKWGAVPVFKNPNVRMKQELSNVH